MIVRIVLALLLCAPAYAQTSSPPSNGEQNAVTSDGRPTSGSVPNFDHTPGAQNSIPSSNSVPNRPADTKQKPQ
jgi:hypothetical protein